MEQKDIYFFTNKQYYVLKLLVQEEINYEGKNFTPLLYEEIGKTLHCTRQTISKIVHKLIKEGYVKSLMKGRLQVTEKGKEIINLFEREVK